MISSLCRCICASRRLSRSAVSCVVVGCDTGVPLRELGWLAMSWGGVAGVDVLRLINGGCAIGRGGLEGIAGRSREICRWPNLVVDPERERERDADRLRLASSSGIGTAAADAFEAGGEGRVRRGGGMLLRMLSLGFDGSPVALDMDEFVGLRRMRCGLSPAEGSLLLGWE